MNIQSNRKKRRAVMVDIETLALCENAIIFEVAAVEFDPVTHHTGREFRCDISPASCREVGMVSDPETLDFWRKRGVTEAGLTGESLKMVMLQLTYFLTLEVQATELWCKGTDFDFPKLAASCRAVGVEVPWKYWQTRDVRTEWSQAFPHESSPSAEHLALLDCYEQITMLQDAAAERKRQVLLNLDIADMLQAADQRGVHLSFGMGAPIGKEVA